MARLLRGEADILRRHVTDGAVPAVRDLDYEAYPDPENEERSLIRITAGTPTWTGKKLPVCEHEINTYGLVSFLRECQHEVGVGGLAFPQFMPSRNGVDWHVCDPFPVPDHWITWASHDYGDPSANSFIVYASDEHGTIYVIGAHRETSQTSSEQCQSALECLEGLGLASPAKPKLRETCLWTVKIDRIDFDYANTFPPEKDEERRGEYPVEIWWRRGMPAIRAVKDRKAGWRRIREVLTATRFNDGVLVPKFRIFRGAAPALEKGLLTCPTYPKDLDEIDPGFKDDHDLDSLRYGMMSRPDKSDKSDAGKTVEERYAETNQAFADHAHRLRLEGLGIKPEAEVDEDGEEIEEQYVSRRSTQSGF